MEYQLGYSPTAKSTTASEPDGFRKMLSIFENEFNTEDRVACLRYVFDKMIESRQSRINEHMEIIAEYEAEIIAIRQAFKK